MQTYTFIGGAIRLTLTIMATRMSSMTGPTFMFRVTGHRTGTNRASAVTDLTNTAMTKKTSRTTTRTMAGPAEKFSTAPVIYPLKFVAASTMAHSPVVLTMTKTWLSAWMALVKVNPTLLYPSLWQTTLLVNRLQIIVTMFVLAGSMTFTATAFMTTTGTSRVG